MHPPQSLAMQDAETETAARQDHRADAPIRRVLWVPPEATQGLEQSRVCVHVHEHGWLTDSTSGEAQGRRETDALQTLAPPGPPGERPTSSVTAPAARASLSPLRPGKPINHQDEV